jgi:hypothetical protein
MWWFFFLGTLFTETPQKAGVTSEMLSNFFPAQRGRDDALAYQAHPPPRQEIDINSSTFLLNPASL